MDRPKHDWRTFARDIQPGPIVQRCIDERPRLRIRIALELGRVPLKLVRTLPGTNLVLHRRHMTDASTIVICLNPDVDPIARSHVCLCLNTYSVHVLVAYEPRGKCLPQGTVNLKHSDQRFGEEILFRQPLWARAVLEEAAKYASHTIILTLHTDPTTTVSS